MVGNNRELRELTLSGSESLPSIKSSISREMLAYSARALSKTVLARPRSCAHESSNLQSKQKHLYNIATGGNNYQAQSKYK